MSKLDTLLEELASDDPKIRRRACDQLAKLGNPAAIPALSKLYKDVDDDDKVQIAAEKALKKFAAMEAGGSGRIGRLLSILLSLSLLVLLVLNVLARLGAGEKSIPPPSDRAALLEGYQNEQLFPALNNLNILQSEWAAGAGNLPCTGTGLTPLTDATLAPIDAYTYPDMIFIDTLNQAIADLRAARTEWTNVCATTKGSPNQVRNAQTSLQHIEGQLTLIADAILSVQNNPAPTNPAPTTGAIPETLIPTATEGAAPTATLTPLPTETPLPSLTPLPTFPPSIIIDLDKIIKDSQFFLNSLIQQRWEASRNGGRSNFACIVDTFPNAYSLPEGQTFADELVVTVDAINGALELAKQSNQSYANNCTNGNLSETIIDQGIANAQQALEAFGFAQDVIDEYQGR